jgi:RimJ/RimL family protein N-acetyltransferase
LGFELPGSAVVTSELSNMIAPYRSEFFSQIAAFARRQPEFDYLQGIIRAHTEQHAPGGIWVWKDEATGPGTKNEERGTVVAVCGMAYLNRDDAWLYGMRVDDRFKGAGIATRFTGELIRRATKSGRTWVGLDTLNHARKAPVFRIMEKLGMRHEATFATCLFWNLPRRFQVHRSSPFPVVLPQATDIFGHWQGLGVGHMFHELYPRWVWTRLLASRRRIINQDGYLICGVPLHLVSSEQIAVSGTRTQVNWFTRPPDFAPILSQLFGYASGKDRLLVINCPAEWAVEIRRTARRLIPELKLRKNCDFATWRVYGKTLWA